MEFSFLSAIRNESIIAIERKTIVFDNGTRDAS